MAANRYLDYLEEGVNKAVRDSINERQAQKQYQKDLLEGYKQALVNNPTLSAPNYSGSSPDYSAVSKELLNQLANNNTYRTQEEAARAIQSDPVLSKLYTDPNALAAASQAVFTRSNEKYSDHKTYFDMLDQDPRSQVNNEFNTEVSDGFFDNALRGAWNTTKDLVSMPFEALGLGRRAQNHKAQADLAAQMSSLGKDTQTGMQKLYTLQELKNQKEELEKASQYSGLSENHRQQLDIINSRIQALTGSLSAAELEAINKNGAAFDNLKRQRDAYASLDPDNWAERTNKDVENERNRAALKMERQALTGNADIFNLDNLAYDWDLLKSYLTKDQLGYFAGMMVPWAVGAEYTGSIKALNAATSGAMRAIMNIGKTPEGRNAIAHAFAEIGRSTGKGAAAGFREMATPMGAAMTTSALASYAGAYSKSSTDFLNEYFNREGTINGFDEIEAGLYGMAEHFANFYGGHIAGKVLPTQAAQKALNKMLGDEIHTAMTAARNAIGAGNEGALANAAITRVISRMANPAVMLQALGEAAGRKAEAIATSRSISGKGGISLASAELRAVEGVSKAASKVLSNSSGMSVAAAGKAGLSLATDNTFASIAHQKGEQKGDIDWNQVGESAIEGLVAGMAGHPSSTAVGYARAALKRVSDRPNGYYDTTETRNKKLEYLNQEENQGTEESLSILSSDIRTLNSSVNKLAKKKDETRAALQKDEYSAYITSDGVNGFKFVEPTGNLSKEEKANAKQAKKLVKQYNKLNEMEAEASTRLTKDKELLNEHIRAYRDKNVDAEFTEDSVLNSLLDKAPEGESKTKVRDYDKDSYVKMLGDVSSMTLKEREKEYEKRTQGKVHTAEEIFSTRDNIGNLTQKDKESDADFAARKEAENLKLEKRALAVARSMGRSGTDLDNLTDKEIGFLATKDWGELQKSLSNRKNAEKKGSDEYDRIDRLQRRYTEEKFNKNKTKINANNMKPEELFEALEINDYMPTEKSIEHGAANNQKFKTDADYATLEDMKKAYIDGKDEKDFRNDIYNRAKDKSKAAQIADNAKDLYSEFLKQIEESIDTHNELVNTGTRTRQIKHSDIKKEVGFTNVKADALNNEAESRAKAQVQKEIDDAGLSEDYEVGVRTYYKNGERITEGFAKRKAGTTLDERKQALDTIYKDLTNNNTLLSDQLKKTNKPDVDKIIDQKNTVLQSLFADTNAKKTLKKFGYESITSVDDLTKQSLPVQKKVIGLLAESVGVNVRTREQNIANKISKYVSRNKGSVFEHYMTGHADIATVLSQAKSNKEYRHKLEDLIDEAKLQVSEEERIGVSSIRKFNLDLNDTQNSGEFEKFLYHQLYNFYGFLDPSGFSPMKLIEEAIVSKNVKGNTVLQGKLNEWASGVQITHKGKQQLNWIVQYLRSNTAKHQENTHISEMVYFLSRLNTLINDKATVVEDGTPGGKDFIVNLDMTSTFSQDMHKNRVNNMISNLSDISIIFNDMGLTPTTESQFSQLYDWHINDMLLKLDEATSLTREAKQFLMSTMTDDMIALPGMMRGIMQIKEWGDICNFLATGITREGNKPGFQVIDALIRNAEADSQVSKETVNFFKGLKNLDSTAISKKFGDLADRSNERHIRDEAISFLLKQVPVLGILGLLEEKSNPNSFESPWEKYNLGIAAVTDSTAKLDAFRDKLSEVSKAMLERNGKVNRKNQAILEFTLLSNLNTINGMSNAYIQNEFTRRLLDYMFEHYGRFNSSINAFSYAVSTLHIKDIKDVATADKQIDILEQALEPLILDSKRGIFDLTENGDLRILPKRADILNAILNQINVDQGKTGLYKLPEDQKTQLAENLTNLVCNNFGKLAGLYRAAKIYDELYTKQGKLKGVPTDISKNFRILSKALAYMDVTINAYSDHRHMDDRTFTKESLPEFINILENAGVTANQINEYIKSYGDSTVEWVMNTLFTDKGVKRDFIVSANKFSDLMLDDDKSNQLAEILGNYINDKTVANTYITSNEKRDDITGKIKNTARRYAKNDYIDKVHRQNQYKLGENAFRKKPKSCLLATEEGVQELLNDLAGSTEGSNAAYLIEQVKSLASKLGVNLKVDTTGKRIVDSVETVNGEFNTYYLRVVSAVALANLPTLSSEMTDDYYATLVERYGYKAARAMKEQKLADQDTVVLSIGESIARSLGYSVHSPFFADAAREAGQHALVALELGGFIKNIHVSKSTGQELGEDVRGEDLAGSVRAIRIDPQGMIMGPKLQARSIYHDASGSHSLLDQFVGRDTQNDTAPLTQTELAEKQKALATDFAENGKLPTKEADRPKGTVVWDQDREIAAINLGNEKKPDWYFMRGKQILKTDDVEVSNERLYQLALKSRQPKFCDRVMTWRYFKDFFDDKGNLKFSEEDAERIESIVNQYPAIKQLIEYHKSDKNYGDTSKLGGEFDINLTIKDKEAFRKMIKNARYLKTLFENELTEQNIKAGHGFGTGNLELYFDEINTVNNRAFVSSVLFNYREYSPFRHLFNMNDENANRVSIDDTSTADRIYPILFCLGLKHDKLNPRNIPNDPSSAKISDDEMVSRVWNKLISLPNNAFVKLLAEVDKNPDDISGILKAIENANKNIKAKAKDNEDAYSYDIVTPELDGGKPATKVFQISDGMETVTALINLTQLLKRENWYAAPGTRARDDIDSLHHHFSGTNLLKEKLKFIAKPQNRADGSKIYFKNYNLRVEIDGLTNGPSIKEAADSMHLRNTEFTKLVVNGVGLSLNQASIMGSQLDAGTLDTYLLNSSVAQYDLNLKEAQNMLRNNYQDSEVLNYFKDLYALTQNNESMALTEIMANILSRDMMKKPVMVVGYEAGMKSVLLKMAMQFDLQTARMLWDGNEDHIRNWLNRAIALNGNQDLIVRFQGTKGTYITRTLSRDGLLDGRESIFGADKEGLRRKLIFETQEQVVLKENLDKVLQNLYQSMTKVMKQPQTPFDMNNEVSQTLAETINSIIGQYVQNYFKDHEEGVNYMDYRKFMYKASEDLKKKICTVFNVGDQQLQTIKQAVDSSISTYLVSMTCTKDDKVFLKTVYKQANFEALGAGEVPMIIHSFDSEIVHAVQQSLSENFNREILAVHDAIIVPPADVTKGGQLMNENYHKISYLSKGTFVSRDVNLLKAINNIKIMTDISPELKNTLLRRLQNLYTVTSNYTISLIQDQLSFFEDQLLKEQKDRQIYNQYALGQITAYQPDDAALQHGINTLNSYLHEYTDTEYYVDKAVEVAPQVIENMLNTAEVKGKINSTELNAVRTALIDPKSGLLNLERSELRNASTVKELIDSINNVIKNTSGAGKVKLNEKVFYGAVNPLVNKDPYVAMLKGIHDYYEVVGDAGKDGQNAVRMRQLRQQGPQQSDPKFNEARDFFKDSDLTSGKSAQAIINTMSEVLDMVSTLTQIYHIDDMREVRARVQTAIVEVMRTKSTSDVNAITAYDKLRILRKAVGNISASQDKAFNDIWKIVGGSTELSTSAMLGRYDNTQPLTLDYSTDLDYEAIANKFSTQFNRDRLRDSRDDRKRSDFAFQWFKRNVIEPMEEQYANYDGQVGFTLNSHMDMLRFRALSYLKETNPTAFGKVKIVIIPNVSNLTKNTAHVSNRALAQYYFIKRENSAGVSVVFNHAPGANNELLSAIMNADITEAAIVNQKNIVTNNETAKIYAPNKGFSGDTFVRRLDFRAKTSVINKLDEMGTKRADPINVAESGEVTGQLDTYMLRTTGIRQELSTRYDFEKVAAMDDATIATEISSNKDKYHIVRPQTDGLVVTPTELMTAATEPGNAIAISVTSNGDIVDNVPYSFTKDVDMFSRAMAEFQSERIEDLAKYNRNEITWEEYIRPRIVNIDIGTGTRKTFVFQVTQDVSFTRAELNNTIEYETYRGRTSPKEVIRDTPFSNMLNTKYQTNTELTNAFTRKYGSDNEMISNKRVPIPIHMLNTAKMKGISSDSLNMRNAVYMTEVQKKLHEKGINKLYYIQNKIDYYPYSPVDSNMSVYYMDMAGMSPSANKGIQNTINQTTSGMVLNMATKAINWLGTVGGKFKARPINNTEVAIRESHYSGYGNTNTDFNAIPDIVKSVLTDGRDVTSVVTSLMAEDNANGIDTSYLNGLAGSLTGLTTNIVLFVDKANTSVRNSMERYVQEPSRTREEIYLAWGRATESKTEAFLHELCHTIFNHLPKDSTAFKQAMDLFDYVQKNFTIENFEDGDTIENRQIMDAIFSERTQDNVSEFLVYAMTNPKFQKAISNMVVPAKVKEALNKRTTGIFNKFVNMINSWINGTAKDMNTGTYIMPMIMDMFNRATALSNSYWNETNKLNNFIAQNMPLAALSHSLDDSSYVAKALRKIPGSLAESIRDTLNIASKSDYNNMPVIRDSIDGELVYTVNESTDEEDDVLARIINDARRHNRSLQEGFINDLLSTFEGASKSQMPYLEMRMKGKHAIDWFRNEAATAVNDRVKEILKDYPTRYVNKLVDCFVRTDVSCLFNSSMSEQEVSKLLTDYEARREKITELETQIRKEKFGNFYVNSSKGLAKYLTTGFNPTGLAYRNAYEIVAISGSSNQQITDMNGPITRAVDQLVTLYAVDDLAQKNSIVYNSLKPEVLKELSLIHNGIKRAEIAQVYRDSAQKYHVPKGQLHGGKVQGRYDIIPESRLRAYEWNGYQKLHDAKLDPFYKGVAERGNTKYVIVAAPNKNPVPTVAGCTVMTDIFKGRSKSGLSFNHENDLDRDIDFRTTMDWRRLKNYVNSRVEALNKPNPQLLQNETDGNLVLNFNYLGELNGANFELNPVKTAQYVNHTIKTSSVFGDLYGSVQERTQVPEFNRKVGEACIEIYENSNQKEEFVFISDKSENKDYRDFYDALPFDVKQAVEDNYKYKGLGLPIRKKSLNTFFGYRHVSSNDTEKLIKEIEENNLNLDNLTSGFTNAIKGIFFNKWVGKAEQMFKYLASVGKENIVIKGIATSWYNILSNYITLNIYGMTPKESVGYQVEAFKQIKTLDDINHDLETLHIKRITGRYTNADAMQEKNLLRTAKALPIYPLVEAGIVANTLAEDLTETDRLVKDTIDKYIPSGMLNNLAHNALMTPKAWMYKILSDFASLGDSTGKYAIYKHLTKKGVTPKEAMRQAVNTFIDYSNPIPKEIQYADDLGMLPFIKFALGTQTNIMNALTKQPDRSLGWIFANSALGIKMPDIFQSLIGIDTVTNRFQLPGELFVDSISQLPSVRASNALGINIM